MVTKVKEKLYILPFDHRESFFEMLGLNGQNLTPENAALISDYKHIVFEGFLRAQELGVAKEFAAISVDEQFGAKIQEEAKALGITRLLPVEKSGQNEFDFEYGDEFGEHIKKFAPEFVRVLVRFNPDGDREQNQSQTAKLKILSDFCRQSGYGFLFELLVPEFAQLTPAINQLQAAGIEPDIWKLAGTEDVGHMEQVVQQTQTGGRRDVRVVILGGGEPAERVKTVLSLAAKITGVAGFAVGRTVFKQALTDHHLGKISREEAAQTIAKNYKGFVDLFESARLR